MADARPNPELPKEFQQSIFKGGWGREGHPRGCDQLVPNPLVVDVEVTRQSHIITPQKAWGPGGPVLMITEWLTSSTWGQGFWGFCHFKNIYLFLIDWWLVYNIGLISVIHQHELTIINHMSPLSWISHPPPAHSHPSRLFQSPGLSFLSHTADSHWPSIYIC